MRAKGRRRLSMCSMSIAVVAVLLFAGAACSKKAEPPPPAPKAVEAAPARQPAPAPAPQANVVAESGTCPAGKVRVPTGLTPWELVEKFDCHFYVKPSKTALKGDVGSIKTLEATTTEYYGKRIKMVGVFKVTATYVGKYVDSKPTHYAFEFALPDDHDYLWVYGPKTQFKRLFEFASSGRFAYFKVVAFTDEKHENDSVWTLVEAEPLTEGWEGQCCPAR